jgi:hypothetical protein
MEDAQINGIKRRHPGASRKVPPYSVLIGSGSDLNPFFCAKIAVPPRLGSAVFSIKIDAHFHAVSTSTSSRSLFESLLDQI